MCTSGKGVHPVSYHFGSLFRRESWESIAKLLPYGEHICHAALPQFVKEGQAVLEPRLFKKVRDWVGALSHAILRLWACIIVTNQHATIASIL